MNASVTTVRRGLFGMFAGGLLAFGSAAIVAPVANSQPTPDCSASNVAGTVSSVAASEGTYLAANPQADQALSAIATQPEPESHAAYGAFFAQNPDVKAQLQAIYQPVTALQDQCGVDVTPTPVSAALTDT